MRRQCKRVAMVLLLCALLPSLSGCWDNHELDSLFIVTGVALDKAEEPGLVDITIQVGKVQSNTESSGASGSQKPDILLRSTAETVLKGVGEIDRNSSRTLLMQHNQALLFGLDLAQEGIIDRLDLFMRDQDTRLEVLMLVVDGRAEEILEAKPEQEIISGLYISRLVNDLKGISPHNAVRLLDFASRLRDETSAPVASLIQVEPKGDKQDIRVEGLAVFKADKMVGILDNSQTDGYLWAMGNVKNSGLTTITDLGKATFNIVQLSTQRDLTLLPSGIIHVTLSVHVILAIGEMSGFQNVTPTDLMPYLIETAQDQMRQRILSTFETARALEADIYQFGVDLHRKYPNAWRQMKEAWGEHFANLELDVRIRVDLPATGQINMSLEMQEERQ